MYYLILLFIISLVTLFFIIFNKNIKNNKTYLFIVMFILVAFLALRGPKVGLDMENYNIFFRIARDNSFKYIISNINFELGFKVYTKFISLFSGDFRFYVGLTSIFSMLGIYFFVRNNSKNYFASVFMFVAFDYYIYNFCTLRQSLAMSFLLLAFNAIKKEKYEHFIMLTITAFLFHKTAIIFMLLYIIKILPNFQKYLRVYLICCLLFLLLKEPIIDLFTSTIYTQYIGYKDMSGSGYYMLILIFCLIGFFGFLTEKVDISNDRKNKLLSLMLFISFPFQTLSLTQGLIARIVLYFSYSFIILIPEYLETLEGKREFFVKILYYSLLTIFFIIEINRNAMYVPYTLL